MNDAGPMTWPVIARGHPFEDHVVGRVFDHHWGRTVHSSDNISFSTQMLAFNPLHFNRDVAAAEGHPDELVNPLLVFSIVFGLSVEDLSEAGGPFLGASDLRYLRAVYPGETLYASSTVVEARESQSRSDAGIVTWHTVGCASDGEPVIEFRRTNLVAKREAVADGDWAPIVEGFAEDFRVGDRFRHARTRTVTDLDLNGLTLQVMNTAPGHFSELEMEGTSFGGRINFGGLTLALTVGLATQDTTGQVLREVGMDDIRFPAPVRHGDTVGASTEVLAVEPRDAEVADVAFRHYGWNQRGEVVCQAVRRVRVRTRAAQNEPKDHSVLVPTTPIGR